MKLEEFLKRRANKVKTHSTRKRRWQKCRTRILNCLKELNSVGIDPSEFFHTDDLEDYWPWWSTPEKLWTRKNSNNKIIHEFDDWFTKKFAPAVRATVRPKQAKTSVGSMLSDLMDAKDTKAEARLRRAWAQRPKQFDGPNKHPELIYNCPWSEDV